MCAVIGRAQHFFLLNRGYVLDGDFHPIDRAQDAAAHFFERVGKGLDLAERLLEELVKTGAKSRVVRGDRGQHAGMVKRRIQPLLQLAHPQDDARIHQRIEVAETRNLFPQGIESAQQLHMLLGQRGHVGIRKNFNQRNFKRRKRQRTIEAITTLLPLAGHTRMAVKERSDQVSLVTIHFTGRAAAHKVAQQSLGYFGVGVGSKRVAQHGRRDRHVEQVQPAIHPRESSGQFALGMAQRVLVEPLGHRHVTAEAIPHELLIEALHRRENC